MCSYSTRREARKVCRDCANVRGLLPPRRPMTARSGSDPKRARTGRPVTRHDPRARPASDPKRAPRGAPTTPNHHPPSQTARRRGHLATAAGVHARVRSQTSTPREHPALTPRGAPRAPGRHSQLKARRRLHEAPADAEPANSATDRSYRPKLPTEATDRSYRPKLPTEATTEATDRSHRPDATRPEATQTQPPDRRPPRVTHYVERHERSPSAWRSAARSGAAGRPRGARGDGVRGPAERAGGRWPVAVRAGTRHRRARWHSEWRALCERRQHGLAERPGARRADLRLPVDSFGSRGVQVAQVAAVAGTLALLARDARRAGARERALAIALLLLVPACFGPIVAIRAQLFSLPLFAACILLLRSETRTPSRRIWLLVPLLGLWGNLHGAVLTGAVVAGAYLVFERGRARPRESIAVALASLLALCANPALWNTPEYVLGVLQNEAARQAIGLWAPLSPHNGLDVAFALAAVGAAHRRAALAAEALGARRARRADPPDAARGARRHVARALRRATRGDGLRRQRASRAAAAPRAAGRARPGRGRLHRAGARPATERRHRAGAAADARARRRHARPGGGPARRAGCRCRRTRLGREPHRRVPAGRSEGLRRVAPRRPGGRRRAHPRPARGARAPRRPGRQTPAPRQRLPARRLRPARRALRARRRRPRRRRATPPPRRRWRSGLPGRGGGGSAGDDCRRATRTSSAPTCRSALRASGG